MSHDGGDKRGRDDEYENKKEKRPRADTGGGGWVTSDVPPPSVPFEPLTVKPLDPCTLRLLVDQRYSGTLIGKKGATIETFRETGAKVKLTDGNFETRVLRISGTLEQAQFAIKKVIPILEERYKEEVKGAPGSPVFGITILVSPQSAGALIGKAGTRISATRETTSAHIKVSTTTMPGSTEKTVSIAGSVEQISQAICMMCQQMVEFSEGGFVVPAEREYVPGMEFEEFGRYDDYPRRDRYYDDPYGRPFERGPPPRDFYDHDYYGRRDEFYDRPPRGYDPYERPPYDERYPPHDPPPPRYPPRRDRSPLPDRHPPAPAPAPEEKERGGAGPVPPGMKRVVIPVANNLAGGLIGKRGATINYLRTESRADIKVGENPEDKSDRLVTVTGVEECVGRAIDLINQVLEEESAKLEEDMRYAKEKTSRGSRDNRRDRDRRDSRVSPRDKGRDRDSGTNNAAQLSDQYNPYAIKHDNSAPKSQPQQPVRPQQQYQPLPGPAPAPAPYNAYPPPPYQQPAYPSYNPAVSPGINLQAASANPRIGLLPAPPY